MNWRERKEGREEALSPLAARSARSLGRLAPEEKCPIRTEYERDHTRILYSLDFRRLRHKTQVFFNAKNDHICTRMEHVLYVASISSTIARALELNQDLAYAIALGHDLGHAPFGHTGERVLDACVKQIDPALGFRHETHSLRVVDRLAARRASGWDTDDSRKNGLNLTFEVRDGIACHCGENYREYEVAPDTGKSPNRLFDADISRQTPATMEGCVVRLADKIAYVGRDIEDAIRAGVIRMGDIPRDALAELGFSNGQIVNTLVSDLIENTYTQQKVALSREKGEALESLIRQNVEKIYRSPRISAYEKSMTDTMEGLFSALHDALVRGADRLATAEEKVFRSFAQYIQDQAYTEADSPAQQTLDFVAGMTDNFALSCYEELFWL